MEKQRIDEEEKFFITRKRNLFEHHFPGLINTEWMDAEQNARSRCRSGSRDGGKHQPVLGIVNLKANRSPVYSPRHKLQTMRPAITGSISKMSGTTRTMHRTR